MTLHWYKRYPEVALAGMKRLTLEERGAYNTALDLIYMHGGALDDDDLFIAGWCSCDVRVWRRIKVKLLAIEKLYADGGKLRNGRADVEVAKALARGASNSYAGQQSAKSRAAKSRQVSNGSNGLAATYVPTESQHNDTPPLGSRNTNLVVTTRAADAARASASPDGPPRTGLTSDEEWTKRLQAYDPSNPRKTWKAFWGWPPDTNGNGHLVPAHLVQWWKAQKAQQRTGVGA